VFEGLCLGKTTAEPDAQCECSLVFTSARLKQETLPLMFSNDKALNELRRHKDMKTKQKQTIQDQIIQNERTIEKNKSKIQDIKKKMKKKPPERPAEELIPGEPSDGVSNRSELQKMFNQDLSKLDGFIGVVMELGHIDSWKACMCNISATKVNVALATFIDATGDTNRLFFDTDASYVKAKKNAKKQFSAKVTGKLNQQNGRQQKPIPDMCAGYATDFISPLQKDIVALWPMILGNTLIFEKKTHAEAYVEACGGGMYCRQHLLCLDHPEAPLWAGGNRNIDVSTQLRFREVCVEKIKAEFEKDEQQRNEYAANEKMLERLNKEVALRTEQCEKERTEAKHVAKELQEVEAQLLLKEQEQCYSFITAQNPCSVHMDAQAFPRWPHLPPPRVEQTPPSLKRKRSAS